jgi:hypothetical protein
MHTAYSEYMYIPVCIHAGREEEYGLYARALKHAVIVVSGKICT